MDTHAPKNRPVIPTLSYSFSLEGEDNEVLITFGQNLAPIIIESPELQIKMGSSENSLASTLVRVISRMVTISGVAIFRRWMVVTKNDKSSWLDIAGVIELNMSQVINDNGFLAHCEVSLMDAFIKKSPYQLKFGDIGRKPPTTVLQIKPPTLPKPPTNDTFVAGFHLPPESWDLLSSWLGRRIPFGLKPDSLGPSEGLTPPTSDSVDDDDDIFVVGPRDTFPQDQVDAVDKIMKGEGPDQQASTPSSESQGSDVSEPSPE